MASGNMKARWNQHRLQGAWPMTSPTNSTASEAMSAVSQAANSGPQALFVTVETSLIDRGLSIVDQAARDRSSCPCCARSRCSHADHGQGDALERGGL
eukprot:23414-Eustigmatos_ZCMA.PRE.1